MRGLRGAAVVAALFAAGLASHSPQVVHAREAVPRLQVTPVGELSSTPVPSRSAALGPDGKSLYLAGDKWLMVVDTASGKLVRWAAHDRLRNLTVDPSGRRLITSTGSRIDVIDTQSLSVIASRELPRAIVGLAISPTNGQVYAAVPCAVPPYISGYSCTPSENSVYVLGPELQVIAQFNGGIPTGLGVSPDGATLYVSDPSRALLQTIDIPTLTPRATVSLGLQASLWNPMIPTPSPDGRYVAVAAQYGVAVVNTATGGVAVNKDLSPGVSAPGYGGERSIGWANGRPLVLEQGGRLSTIDADTGTVLATFASRGYTIAAQPKAFTGYLPVPCERATCGPEPIDTVNLSQAARMVTNPAAPLEPASVSAVPRSTAIKVTWAPPRSSGQELGPVTGYEAVAVPGGSKCATRSTVRSCTIGRLKPSTSYRIYVRAKNAAGWSLANWAGAETGRPARTPKPSLPPPLRVAPAPTPLPVPAPDPAKPVQQLF